MTDETPVERLLRQHVKYRRYHGESETVSDAIDCGREAIRLLAVFQCGPSGSAWMEWLSNVDALLTKCREAQR